MGLLLDTHALLWWLSDNQRLSHRAADEIGRSPDVRVSAVSFYEIRIKHGRGQLEMADRLIDNLEGAIDGEGFHGLSLSPGHANRAAALPFHHRDPFDRMLIAQALAEDLTLVSNERLFDAYGVERLW